MRSRTSFFNPGVAKNLLRRCWPLWAGYLFFLLLVLPLPLRQSLQYKSNYDGALPALDTAMAGYAEVMLVVSFLVAILTVMAMFSYLYTSRGCGMMNALPLTRTAMFFTAALTGLLPLLLADLAACACCLPFVASGDLSLRVLGWFLGINVCGKLFFYGFALLCAMLTGSLLILPLVYLVLNFTALVAELATRYVLSRLLFGLDADAMHLAWLSPLVQMMTSCVSNVSEDGKTLALRGLGTTALYGAAGVLLSLGAWRLYLRRQMETATDTVAIPALKPVFKYCMAYGCGVLLAAFADGALFMVPVLGRPAALLTALFVLAGSLLGYFAAEMLIRKTVKVFRGTWRGWLVFAAAALLVIGLCEFDPLGWEKSQPKAEDIVSVRLNDTVYEETASVEAILDWQRGLVANKKLHETSPAQRPKGYASASAQLWYTLKNGRIVSRNYKVIGFEAQIHDDASDIAKLQALINLPEALRFRSLSEVEVKPENVLYFEASYQSAEDTEFYSLRFTEEEAVDFYTNALLRDLAQNKVGRRFLYDDGTLPRESNVHLSLEFYDRAASENGAAVRTRGWYSITVYEDNAEILSWLRAHGVTDIRFTDQTETASEFYPASVY